MTIVPRSWEWYKMVYTSIPESELRKLYEEHLKREKGIEKGDETEIMTIVPRSWEWYKMVYTSIPESELRKLYEEQIEKK